MIDERIAQVEKSAVAAWPAGRAEERAGWLLRHTPGVPRRRSNSALPPAADRHPERTLDAVEAFYRDRGLPVIVQVSPAEGQTVLDAALAARGYRSEAPTLVLTAPVTTAAPTRGRPVEIDEGPSPRWLAAYQALNGPGDTSAVAERVLARVPTPAAFLHVTVAGAAAAIGLFVAGPAPGGPWAGVFCMATDVRHRRRGLASAVLAAGAQWAAAVGCSGLYLQVERDNIAARDLYARAGFTPSHSYHYRVSDTDLALRDAPTPDSCVHHCE